MLDKFLRFHKQKLSKLFPRHVVAQDERSWINFKNPAHPTNPQHSLKKLVIIIFSRERLGRVFEEKLLETPSSFAFMCELRNSLGMKVEKVEVMFELPCCFSQEELAEKF